MYGKGAVMTLETTNTKTCNLRGIVARDDSRFVSECSGPSFGGARSRAYGLGLGSCKVYLTTRRLARAAGGQAGGTGSHEQRGGPYAPGRKRRSPRQTKGQVVPGATSLLRARLEVPSWVRSRPSRPLGAGRELCRCRLRWQIGSRELTSACLAGWCGALSLKWQTPGTCRRRACGCTAPPDAGVQRRATTWRWHCTRQGRISSSLWTSIRWALRRCQGRAHPCILLVRVGLSLSCVCVRARACVRVCVRARACVCALARVCVCVSISRSSGLGVRRCCGDVAPPAVVRTSEAQR